MMADSPVFERLNVTDRAGRVRLQLGWHHAPDDSPGAMVAVARAELRNIAGMIEDPSPDNTEGSASLRIPGSKGRIYLRFQMPPDLALADLIAFLNQAAEALPQLAARPGFVSTPWSSPDEGAWEYPVPTCVLDE